MVARQLSFPGKRQLFFSQAPKHFNEVNLMDMFSQYGSVEDIVLFRTYAKAAVTKGCGLVTFSAHEEAAAALQALHGKRVNGQDGPAILMRWSQEEIFEEGAGLGPGLDGSTSSEPPPQGCSPDAVKLYVGNIPMSYTESNLIPLFSSFGQVVEFSIMRRKENGISSGYGFLWMRTRAQADAAKRALNLKHILDDPQGRNTIPLAVRLARQERDGHNVATHRMQAGETLVTSAGSATASAAVCGGGGGGGVSARVPAMSALGQPDLNAQMSVINQAALSAGGMRQERSQLKLAPSPTQAVATAYPSQGVAMAPADAQRSLDAALLSNLRDYQKVLAINGHPPVIQIPGSSSLSSTTLDVCSPHLNLSSAGDMVAANDVLYTDGNTILPAPRTLLKAPSNAHAAIAASLGDRGRNVSELMANHPANAAVLNAARLNGGLRRQVSDVAWNQARLAEPMGSHASLLQSVHRLNNQDRFCAVNFDQSYPGNLPGVQQAQVLRLNNQQALVGNTMETIYVVDGPVPAHAQNINIVNHDGGLLLPNMPGAIGMVNGNGNVDGIGNHANYVLVNGATGNRRLSVGHINGLDVRHVSQPNSNMCVYDRLPVQGAAMMPTGQQQLFNDSFLQSAIMSEPLTAACGVSNPALMQYGLRMDSNVNMSAPGLFKAISVPEAVLRRAAIDAGTTDLQNVACNLVPQPGTGTYNLAICNSDLSQLGLYQL